MFPGSKFSHFILHNVIYETYILKPNFSISNYVALQSDCEKKWNFHNSFFFSGTLATTIGYGNVVPETRNGKIFCLLFVTVGIPYFGYMMSMLSDNINIVILKVSLTHTRA